MKVGFIGLGRMGRGMARRILEGGHDLTVYDVAQAAADALGQAGARVATSVPSLCEGRQVVVTMLVDDPTLGEVATGLGGLCDSLASGAIHLAMGTHGVSIIRTLAAAHATARQLFVAAPVMGRPDLAAAGQLGIVTGGAADAVRQCEPLFERLGRRTFHAGSTPETATVVKLANNHVLECAIAAMAEAFSLVRKYGVDREVLYDVLTEGLFSAPAYTGYGKAMVEDKYDRAGSPVTLGLKDANLILEAADLASVPMPGLTGYRERLMGAIAHGDGDRDQAVLAREQARASGLE